MRKISGKARKKSPAHKEQGQELNITTIVPSENNVVNVVTADRRAKTTRALNEKLNFIVRSIDQ